VAGLTDVDEWRRQTLSHLQAARDLELISVWSPTFLLRLLEDIPDPVAAWPRLKLVSCWASGSAARYAPELRRRLPHAAFQPKGLLSTEAVVTVPGTDGRPQLSRHGFFEFALGNEVLLAEELRLGEDYEVIATTASGLYRYRTGDRVRFEGRTPAGDAILEFQGRNGLGSDLVGEKLTESFVAACLNSIPGFAMLVPEMAAPGYVLICAQAPGEARMAALETALCANPQYAYARKLGQLAPLRVLAHPRAFPILEQVMLARGTRLGDVKPLALRSETGWPTLFDTPLP
jgi:hypothetical protein